jgi:hypothetical protein
LNFFNFFFFYFGDILHFFILFRFDPLHPVNSKFLAFSLNSFDLPIEELVLDEVALIDEILCEVVNVLEFLLMI